ncbi:MAG: hypothetical protein HC846_02975 [Blastocatellia bacterium]|nr:hypothetical protein [Blastocatellia bacterium]
MNAIIRPLSAADAHNSVLMTLRNWHANRIEEDAHLINQQTLLIWGEDDTVVPKEMAKTSSVNPQFPNGRFSQMRTRPARRISRRFCAGSNGFLQ